MAPSNSGVVILVPVLPISKPFFKNSEITEVLCHYISFYVMVSSYAMESTCVFISVVYACLLVHVCLLMPWCLCLLRSEVDVYPHCSVIRPESSMETLTNLVMILGNKRKSLRYNPSYLILVTQVLVICSTGRHTLEALFSCGVKSVRPIP